MAEEQLEREAVLGPWSCCARPPGSVTHPGQLDSHADWLAAPVPGTAASALRAAGRWDFDRPADLEAQDWWYRTSFRSPGTPCRLCFDGLATLAEIWLNGERLLATANMFRSWRIDLAPHLRDENELVIGFRSVAEELRRKRPRPRWKTALVAEQQLRWVRTSLLGRIPGWSPAVPAVGPWRDVRLDTRPFAVSDLHVSASLEGRDGIVRLAARIASPVRPAASLALARREVPLGVSHDGDAWRLSGSARVADAPRWWPHTHGGQPLFPCEMHVDIGTRRYTSPLGAVGFRELAVRQDGGFRVEVNGEPIFCRGACWTVGDIFSPGDALTLAHDLRLARDAGANMIRIGGTMTYESGDFYRLCDELGLLVWQDFMFANMDYPSDDPAFRAEIEAEAREQLLRLAPHPCVAVLCGGSEVEQQAAMRGAPRELWRSEWFASGLPGLCRDLIPDAGYVPSSPSGGDLPFHVREGVSHYYGLGAYLRSPGDLRKDDVAFTSECLGFANIPEQATVDEVMGGAAAVTHHPRWKQRVPRDTGSGYDFEDVRDFYLRLLFGVDPVRLRSFDPARYLQLSRAVPGEVMTLAFSEWRSQHSRCTGAITWFYKDLWPGAGWGIIDSLGRPKAPYFALKRAWQPRQLLLTDEGLDGLHLHVINEAATPLEGRVELALLKDGHVVVAHGEAPCRVPPRGRLLLRSDALLDGFHDVAYAYRFGPPGHDVSVATLLNEGGVVSEAFHFVEPREPLPVLGGLEAEAVPAGDGSFVATLHATRLLRGVSLDAKGYLPDDNHFHLAPLRPKTVRLTPTAGTGVRLRAFAEALNLAVPVPIRPRGSTQDQ
ncbi:MAG: hypothetical protein U0840_12570 [Gemmataceae bacterium]